MIRRPLFVWFCIAVVMLFTAHARAQTIPTGFQEYHVLGNEQHVWNMFNLVAVGEGQPAFSARMYSVLGCAASADNQIVYFDQWEDGFEADVLNPVQATTLVLGDGNPANGDAQSFTIDPRVTSDALYRGTNLTFASDQTTGPTINQYVPMPRSAAQLRYDGGDRIYSSGGPVTLVHYQRPDTTFIGGSTEIISRQAVESAVSYSVPVGVNTYTRYGGNGMAGSPFKYVYLDLVAFDDNTQVFVDNKAGGTASFVLNKGQHWSSQGLIDGTAAPALVVREGTKVSTTKPIAGMFFTGGTGTYQTRFYTLLPDIMHAQDFIITAPGDNPGVAGNRPLNLYVYNPNPLASINVTATDSVGSNTFSIPANSVVAYTETAVANRAVPSNSTVRLTSNANFWGISAYEYNGLIVDWGHSWLANKFLTPFYAISWSPGTRDPVAASAAGCGTPPCNSLNRSPVFVSATQNNTQIRIDLNNDGVWDMVDTNSDDIPDAAPLPGNVYQIDALESLRIYDYIDYDNTGTQIIASKPIAVAYGQDTEQGENADDTLDLGNGVFPLNQKWLDPVLTIDKAGVPNSVPSAGGDVVFTLTVDGYSFGPLTAVTVFDFLPVGTNYVPGTTLITYPGGATSTNDPTITPPTPPETRDRLDWGLTPDTIDQNETLTVRYTVHFAGAMPNGVYLNEAHANGTLGFASIFSPQTSATTVKTDVVMNMSVAQPTAIPGAVLDYTLTVDNSGVGTEQNSVITVPVPSDTTYVPGSACCGGVFDPAQNAIVWQPGSLTPGASLVLTFQLQVNPLTPAGTVITTHGNFESDQTPGFDSNSVDTVIDGPDLQIVKTGPTQASPGDRITYTIKVTNVGAGPATNVLLSDAFPTNSTYVASSMIFRFNSNPYVGLTDAAADDEGTAFANRVELLLATVAPGDSVEFRFTVKVNAAIPTPTYVNNQATLSATQFAPTDSNLHRVFVDDSSSITPPPVVDSPIYDTDTVITGTSVSPDGTQIDVYQDGVFIGTTTVTGGTWTLPGVSGLVVGDQITATATEPGKTTSNPSAPVTVLHIGTFVPAPVVNDPLYETETTITGTSVSPDGTLIDVFIDGVWIGQTVVTSGGVWIIDGVGPLVAGQVITAVATEPGIGTSQPSNQVIVQALPPIYKRSSAMGAPVVPGQTLTYTLVINNTDVVDWTNIVVTDSIDPNTTFVPGSTIVTAPVASGGNYRHEFNARNYTANNGSLTWGGNWTEGNDDNSATNGHISVEQDGARPPYTLRLRDNNRTIARSASLAGYTDATISFVYRRDSLDDNSDFYDLELWNGSAWVQFLRIDAPAGPYPVTDAGYTNFSVTLTSAANPAYFAAGFQLRFSSNAASSMGDDDIVWIDDVDITVSNRQVTSVAGCDAPTLVGDPGCTGYTLRPGETMFVTYDVVVNPGIPTNVDTITNAAAFTTAQTPVPQPASITDLVDHGLPDMLRNDEVTSYTSYDPASIFVRAYPLDPALDGWGFDGISQLGEGALTSGNGSSDDDDFYDRDVTTGWLDADMTVLGDSARPLVFYELDCPACVIKLKKDPSGTIAVTW